MRCRLHEQADQAQERLRGLGSVKVYVSKNSDCCPLCDGPMVVQKTGQRIGRTLAHGSFEAWDTVSACVSKCRWASGVLVIRRGAGLVDALIPGRMVGYDVMVFVGIQRFLRHQQREEIQAALLNNGVPISTGEVSDLAKLFTQYIGRLHRDRAGELKAALEQDGGWPMHVDATGEAGRGTLLIVIAGWRRWVLGSWKISTERTDIILPCLRETVRRFGNPCAAMRDLGKAMTPAIDLLVSELKLTIPVLACHQHFLSDIGKDLLEPAHAMLRSLFRSANVRAKLASLVRDLSRRLGKEIEKAREAVHSWLSITEDGHQIESGFEGLAEVRALAQWILDFNAQTTGLDFPFDRPYLDLYDRCITALRACDAFLRNPPKDKEVAASLQLLHRYISPVVSEVPFKQAAKRLRRRATLFDKLRGVLRIAASLPEEETEQDIKEMHEQLDLFVASLRNHRPARGPAMDIREAIDVILKHIDVHGPNLWGHAIRLTTSAGDSVRLVSRTNFLAENFFGNLKHCERRRSGRKNLGQDLEHLPSEAALVRNLEHEDYVNIVCGSLQRLPQAFAEIDRKERERILNCIYEEKQNDDFGNVQQISSSSLSKSDRCIVRTEKMNRRIAAAAGSRAPRL